MSKLNVRELIRGMEIAGGKVNMIKLSKWIEVKNTKIQLKVTLLQIQMFDNFSWMAINDTTNQLMSQGNGLGFDWVTENELITEDKFWDINNPGWGEIAE